MLEENKTQSSGLPEEQTLWRHKRLQYLDGGIAILAAILSIFIYVYYNGYLEQQYILLWSGIFIIISLFYARKALTTSNEPVINLVVDNSDISSVVMLNEQGNIIKRWDTKGKTALLIGKHTKNKEVDIDLSDSMYDALIHNEHAVMNFAAGKWYLEAVHTPSGITVQKADDRMRYRLTGAKPCRLEQGDVVYIANTRLLMK